jgi:hypothetical protein
MRLNVIFFFFLSLSVRGIRLNESGKPAGKDDKRGVALCFPESPFEHTKRKFRRWAGYAEPKDEVCGKCHVKPGDAPLLGIVKDLVGESTFFSLSFLEPSRVAFSLDSFLFLHFFFFFFFSIR